MYSIYQLYCMNGMKTPFEIKRRTWGNMTITVDHVDNFHYSAGDWRCDAYTGSEHYEDWSYGTVTRDGKEMRVIGCGGNYSWTFASKKHDESLIRPYREYDRPKSEKGLTVLKAGKNYVCRHCRSPINRGEPYERYAVRHAGKLGQINEVFCVGCRDKLREAHFDKPAGEVKFSEIMDAWKGGVLV